MIEILFEAHSLNLNKYDLATLLQITDSVTD